MLIRAGFFICCLGFLLSGMELLAVRRQVANTTLVHAIRWASAALVCWIVVCVLECLAIRANWSEHVWYFTAILSCCPFISVLGARRPTNRIWSLFILFPLVAVLGWPAATDWSRGEDLPPLLLQTPMLIGYVLVLIMGLGNYVGTRFTISAGLVGCGLGWLITTLAGDAGFASAPVGGDLLFSAGCVLTGCWHAAFQRHPAEKTGKTAEEMQTWNVLWFDFRDQFGIVWSQRIQDRVNQIAETEQWSHALGIDGFQRRELPKQAKTPVQDVQQTEARIEQTLRWLLRRFVDPDWIDVRVLEHVEPLRED